MFDVSIELSVLYKGDSAVIIPEDYNSLRIRIIKIKKLI